MKRHPSLEPFSRDHNVGLTLARRLKQASELDQPARREAASSLIDYWRDEMEEHFSEEEHLLLPIIDEASLGQRLRKEHCEITKIVAQIREGSIDPADLATVGTLLDEHIRWEERVLFPTIESSATPKQLESLGKQSASLEERRSSSKWAPRRGELMNRRK